MTTFINGWYCPQCKKLTEHNFVYYKRTKYLECTICKTKTVSKPTTNFSQKYNSRLASKEKNSGHYHGHGKTNGWMKYPKTGKDPRLQVEKHKIWGRLSNV